MVFKTLDIRQYWTMNFEKSPTMNQALSWSQLTVLWVSSCSARKDTGAEPSPWTKLWRWGRKFQVAKGLGLAWLSTEENCVDTTPATHRRSSLSFQQSTGQHIGTSGSGKNHSVLSTHRKLKMPIPTSQSEKSHHWLALGTLVRRASTQE